MMSPDGACKSFDASGNGYARAEGIAVVVLRRAGVGGTPFTAPRKPYAQILGIGTNSDGFKDNGITFPSDTAQSALSMKVGRAVVILLADGLQAQGEGVMLGAFDALRWLSPLGLSSCACQSGLIEKPSQALHWTLNRLYIVL